MKNSDAKHVLREIDAALSKRKRMPHIEIVSAINDLRKKILAGFVIDLAEANLLLAIYEKLTEGPRLKHGNHVRIC